MNNRLFYLIATIILCISCAYIAHTYKQTDISSDELVHVATGMEWWENGTYYFEALHPPLSRVAIAMLPYLSGERLGNEYYKDAKFINTPAGYKAVFEARYKAGKQVFFGKDEEHYRKMLVLTRIMTLPFFILGGFLVAIWSRKLFGDFAGIASVSMYAFLPIIVSSAMLATTDMSMATFLIASLIAFEKWLIKPSNKYALVLGVAFGFLCISKFSGPIFFMLLAAPLIILKDYANKSLSRGFSSKIIGQLLLSSFVTFMMIWSIYRFDVAPLNYPFFLGNGAVENFLSSMDISTETSEYIANLRIVPFPEFFHGLGDLSMRVKVKFAGYIFGQVLDHGVWYFFFAATLFKTPLAFLIFTMIGSIICIKQYTNQSWQKALPLLYMTTLYAASTTFNINIALRHILPVFFFASIICGPAIILCIKNRKLMIPAIALLISFFTLPLYTKPISYFNILAGDHPENILVDNDLEIGQEITIARDRLKELGILEQTKLYSFPVTSPSFFGFKDYYSFSDTPHTKDFRIKFGQKKYILISITLLKILDPNQLGDIENLKPIERICDSFMLYKR